MSDLHDFPDEFLNLLDAYCSDQLDDEGLRALEAHLLANPEARHLFAEYFHHHTEIQFTMRARRAADLILTRLEAEVTRPADRAAGWLSRRAGFWSRSLRWAALAASVLVVSLGGFAALRLLGPSRAGQRGPDRTPSANVAWLVNAQDCQWVGTDQKPGRDMRAGKTLRLARGLAEIEFDRGARIILQGPASLELLSGNSAKLLHGTITARVPPGARGFTVVSPRGKVIDLGTEFGLSVDDRGATIVRVFAGEVEAIPLGSNRPAASGVTLHQNQAARIDGRTVALQPHSSNGDAGRYIRAIVPPPLVTPRTLALDFSQAIDGTLQDAQGRGIGLTHRLPGTGENLPIHDPNLQLDLRSGSLLLTTTRSDINTQDHMPTGEYLGVRLADLGFTGREDFAMTATIPNIPGLAMVGQFGLYAGTRSDENIRGGLISLEEPDRYELFLVNNHGGRDSDLYEVGLLSTGDDLRLTLRRIDGKYSLVVENLTRQSSSTLTIAHPAFLDGQRELYVGLFGANTQSNLSKTLTIKEVKVTVWTIASDERLDLSTPSTP
jgi:hypothetical protein